MDRISRATRSQIMSRVKNRDTAPELAVRKFLYALGFRFRLHVKTLPGSPDIVFLARKKAIFVHGCFWHSHPRCARGKKPTSNIAFWNQKLQMNVTRDKNAKSSLSQRGWRVLTLWECEIRNRAFEKKVFNFLEESAS
jgi:DNA mismatch endonuclease (patch repair protein)